MRKWGIVFLSAMFAFYFSRAFFVTVTMHDFYVAEASGNKTGRISIPAARGVITDSSGKVIASNTLVDGKIIRYYPQGEIVASVVGYISDGAGVSGLEKQYDEQLRGFSGERVVEETAVGKETKELRRIEPVSGKSLATNIDLGLMTESFWSLKEGLAKSGKSGAVVVSKLDGQILSLVSLPSYDPNLFIGSNKRGVEGGDYSRVSDIISDSDKIPLFNRAISGVYPPGSIYKLITSIAALETKSITADEMIDDSGEIVIGNYRYGNWLFDKYGRTEGKINLRQAIARSNDIYFYRIGERTGVDKLVSWSKKLGIGEKTGIDLPGEVTGLLPSPLWQEKEKGERWFLGNTYHLSIGQGNLLTTPVQVDRFVSGVVSGKLCELRLVGNGWCRDIGLSDDVRAAILEGMKSACMEGGTAYPFFSLAGRVYCKTGTAQHGGEKDKPHAWISVVLPKGEKKEDWIVVTVLLESGGEGSSEAGPVAKRIVDYLLK